MDIVLDSNIFRGDITLRSKDFEVLFDYLAKTESSIILPQIILDEILGLYKRTILDRQLAYKNAISNLNLSITDNKKHLILHEFNIDDELKEYDKFIKSKLKIADNKILPYNNEYLPEIAKRAIERKKPAGEDGQGFRDALIWLTIKDYCINSYEKQLMFIGNNSSDFSNKEKTDLHPSLIEECEISSIKITHYKSIKEFVETHSIKISFITEDWLNENIDFDVAEDIFKDKISSKYSHYISSIIKHNTGMDCTGQFEISSANLNELTDFFVYEKIDNKLIVNVTVYYDFEVDFEYMDGPYDIQVSLDRSEAAYWSARHSTNLYASAFLTLTIVDKVIQDYDIEEIGVN